MTDAQVLNLSLFLGDLFSEGGCLTGQIVAVVEEQREPSEDLVDESGQFFWLAAIDVCLRVELSQIRVRLQAKGFDLADIRHIQQVCFVRPRAPPLLHEVEVVGEERGAVIDDLVAAQKHLRV